MDDDELLRAYVDRQSEKAFAELVSRHVDLVYSTALRIVQEASLAKDVVQSVFIHLARKAPTIRSGHALPGWLYRVARCQSINAVRNDRTRREREAAAMNIQQIEEQPDAAWKSIEPHLDDAMNTLSSTEQNAIVLRFFEGRSWREVGGALSLNEDTAQKRVSRAIEKLRSYFQRRGVATSALLVSSAIAVNAVQAAPIGLASAVTSASLTGAASAGGFCVLSTFIKTLVMKKTTGIALSLAALILAGGTAFVLYSNRADKPVTAKNVLRGLVLHFPFDREEAGATDVSGTGNNGRIVGAEWTYDDVRGGVYQFASRDQYILVPTSDSPNPKQITLSAWIKTSSQNETWRRVFDKSWTEGFALSVGGGYTPGNKYLNKATIEIGMGKNRNKGFVCSKQVITDGQWHHLATTYDGEIETLYVDGVPQQMVAKWSGVVPQNGHDLTIGINLSNPNPKYNEVGTSFDGLIDEPMVFNRALSANEIQFLCDSQRK